MGLLGGFWCCVEWRKTSDRNECVPSSLTNTTIKITATKGVLIFVVFIRFVRDSIATEPNVKVKQSKKRPKTTNDTTLDCTATFAPHSSHRSIRFLGCPVYVNEMKQKGKWNWVKRVSNFQFEERKRAPTYLSFLRLKMSPFPFHSMFWVDGSLLTYHTPTAYKRSFLAFIEFKTL